MSKKLNKNIPTPFGNGVIIEFLKSEKKTEGGLIIPDSVEPLIKRALIIAKGVDTKTVQVGETWLVNKNTPQPLPIDDKEYFILAEEGLLCTAP